MTVNGRYFPASQTLTFACFPSFCETILTCIPFTLLHTILHSRIHFPLLHTYRSNDLPMQTHPSLSEEKTKQLILRSGTSEKFAILSSYSMYVRPHLDYTVHLCFFNYRKDIELRKSATTRYETGTIDSVFIFIFFRISLFRLLVFLLLS